MKVGNRMVRLSIEKPKLVIIWMVLITLLLGALITRVKVDTDPENMLSEKEAVRVFHHETKRMFGLHDVVVLGIVNETHPDGVFNPETLTKVDQLTRFAMNLADEKDGHRRVVTRDVIAPGTVDDIQQAGPGQVRFEWLMPKAPETREEALKIRDRAMANPLLKGTLVSEDGQALAIYLPITEKDFAYEVRSRLLEKIKALDGDEAYYITGLPVAEDTFGVEMFTQMAMSAPLAMVAIFILMLLFFKKIKMVIPPMIVAMTTVISTMGLLIGTGNTVHIMSSMIPIFLMPIAVVDSIHILSEFFDSYQQIQNRRKTLEKVMGHLFRPMLYTSLTSSAGFASLALTPIPPVRVFGIFVAVGIMFAWLLTIIFIPAYVMLLKEKSLAGFGVAKSGQTTGGRSSFLNRIGNATYTRSKLIVLLTVAALVVAGFGISKIEINDNPVKWFHKSHDIRVADRVLNKHFGGTYEAYLVLENAAGDLDLSAAIEAFQDEIKSSLAEVNPDVTDAALALAHGIKAGKTDAAAFLTALAGELEAKMDLAPDDEYDLWAQAMDALDRVANRGQIFKRPDLLRYVARLQTHLVSQGVVGKSNSVTDVTRKVYMELFEGNADYYRVPDTVNAVAQSLISYQNSHKPDDLWHLVTPDYAKANVWVQLKSGDNKDMEATIAVVDAFFQDNPPPVPLNHQWAGLTYINVVWQNKMVKGMLESFLSSFLVVFLMMAVLFRSPFWGFLAMIPLSVTIALIYGIIGIVGKDYDMPVAVLSSLTLGLAVDFAIHFLERSRQAYAAAGSWREAIKEMFEEPARAIARNIIVIAVGFTPLLLASLVPYQTVGLFLASIMAISGLATLFILPALIKLGERWLFQRAVVTDDGNRQIQA
ncbi:MAG: MMPL family transporter [Deltaproteobacteria bacterium]|nr:MMPL family transporter [Deltaproteobacteria bacterium]